MATTVVVKLLGRNLSYSILQNRIQSLRILSQQFHLMDMENGYFLVKFQSRVDYDKVLTQGPWIVLGQYLTVQPWTSEFDSLHKLSLAMRWDGYQAGLSDGQGVEREICKDGGRHRFETTPGLSNHG
ncbi:hypothetical protein GOBAR_DD00880 [Gossypium barbadense]|nr:hypothetical protein GOBAR_DD00880 [Gossypium barbadense]